MSKKRPAEENSIEEKYAELSHAAALDETLSTGVSPLEQAIAEADAQGPQTDDPASIILSHVNPEGEHDDGKACMGEVLGAFSFAVGIPHEAWLHHDRAEMCRIANTAADFIRQHSDAPAEAVLMQIKLKHRVDLLPAAEPRRLNLALALFKTSLQSLAAFAAEDAKAAEVKRQAEAWAAATAKPIREEERGLGAELDNPFAPSSLAKSLPA